MRLSNGQNLSGSFLLLSDGTEMEAGGTRRSLVATIPFWRAVRNETYEIVHLRWERSIGPNTKRSGTRNVPRFSGSMVQTHKCILEQKVGRLDLASQKTDWENHHGVSDSLATFLTNGLTWLEGA